MHPMAKGAIKAQLAESPVPSKSIKSRATCILPPLAMDMAGSMSITPVGGCVGEAANGNEALIARHAPAMNFSHIFKELSFGKYYPGLKNPLDGVAEFAEQRW